MSENDPAHLRLSEAFYIRKCKPTLKSRENVVNSQTFLQFQHLRDHFFKCLKALLEVLCLETFHHILERCIPFTVYFYSFHTFVTSFTPYTFFAYIQLSRNIFSSLMMLLIGESLDFTFLNSSLRLHQNSVIFFNYAAEGQHEQIIKASCVQHVSILLTKRG